MSKTLPPPEKVRALELLVYVQNERATFALPLQGEVVIGRSQDCDIRIEHRSVSRRHVRLHLGERLEIEDVGSSNGTFFLSERRGNGAGDEDTGSSRYDQQLAPGNRAPLRLGELVRMGQVLMLVNKKTPSTAHEALRPARRSVGSAIIIDPEVRRVHELAIRTAQSDITVLVLGETGVGKEVLAETVHLHSKRADGPFLRLNCAALSESLLESEIFGHERGAFTGALAARPGLLEATEGGTVLLDEIGELPLSIQVKLLRVLEERAVRRIGSAKSRRIDVRFVTATNRNLEREIAAGRFREDLYFRINKVTLTLPPLRERRSEIEPLARYFLHDFCRNSEIREPHLTPDAVAAMMEYPWPGNVRELKNVMERAPFLVGDGAILREHIPSRPRPSRLEPVEIIPLLDETDFDETTDLHEVTSSPSTLRRPATERDRIIEALEACGGNQTRAAKLLGVSRRTLVNRLDEYGLPRPKKAGSDE